MAAPGVIARRIDRDRQIFEEHVERPRPFVYSGTAQALADVAVTGFLRYCALSGRGVPFHYGMHVMTDPDAPWSLTPRPGP